MHGLFNGGLPMVSFNVCQFLQSVLFRVDVFGGRCRRAVLPKGLLRVDRLPIRATGATRINVGRWRTPFICVFNRVCAGHQRIHFSGHHLLYVRAFGRILRLPHLFKNEGGHVRVLVGDGRSNLIVLTRNGVKRRGENVSDVIRRYRSLGNLLRGTSLVGRVMCLLQALILMCVRRRLVPPNANFPISDAMVIPFCVLFCLLRFDLVSCSPSLLSSRFHGVVTRDGRFVAVGRRVKEVCFCLLPFATKRAALSWPRTNENGRASRSRVVCATVIKARVMGGHLYLSAVGKRLRASVALLGSRECFVCCQRVSQRQVATLRSWFGLVIVAVEGTINAHTKDLSALHAVGGGGIYRRYRDGRGRYCLSWRRREPRRMSST